MFTKERSVHDTVHSFKEAIDTLRSTMGPANADRYKARVDDLYEKAFRHGIRLAAQVAADYDKYSCHGYLVSECILGKLNVMKREPKKNPTSMKINEALGRLERKVDSLAGTTRLMAMAAKRKRRS